MNENVKDDIQVSSWYSWVAAGLFTDIGKWEGTGLEGKSKGSGLC